MTDATDHLRDLVAEVAAAYFSNSHVSVGDIPQVIALITSSLAAVSASAPVASDAPADAEEQPVAQTRATPAQIRKSITPDALISFEDGKGYKTLRRHLSTKGLTPEQYRGKWGLASDYPMVAPAYSAQRSALALSSGLGQKGRAARTAAGVAPAPVKRGPGRPKAVR
ncbi:MAG: MucR family transcriptional regulator [Caulobacteraceae bacterium]|nr:MucR family transcriptional regulator [Caulobacteraceae bacterium]